MPHQTASRQNLPAVRVLELKLSDRAPHNRILKHRLSVAQVFVTMFKLARSRPLAAALRAVKVCGNPHDWTCPLAAKADTQQQDIPPRSSALQQKRFLSIHEYLSANLLKTVSAMTAWLGARAYYWQYGVGVPKGEVARSAAEAEKIAKEIGTRHLVTDNSVYELS